jgi:hypothetical protein
MAIITARILIKFIFIFKIILDLFLFQKQIKRLFIFVFKVLIKEKCKIRNLSIMPISNVQGPLQGALYKWTNLINGKIENFILKL